MDVYDDGKPGWKTNLSDEGDGGAGADGGGDGDIQKQPGSTDYDDGIQKKAGDYTDDENSEGGDGRSASKNELAAAEGGGATQAASAGDTDGEDTIGDGYNDKDSSLRSRVSGALKGRRKTALIGGGLVAAGGSVTIALMLALMPLKIQHILENIKGKYMKRGEHTVSMRLQNNMARYMQKYIMPGMKNGGMCSSTKTISADCIASPDGKSFTSKMYRGWRDGRLENKLATKYGLEFEYRQDKKFYLKTGFSKDIDVSALEKMSSPSFDGFEPSSGKQLRAKIDEALDGESKFKKVLVRMRIMKLLQRKYSTRYCVFACKVNDKFAEIDAWKKGVKGKVVGKIVTADIVQKHTKVMGLAIGCVISPDCNNDPRAPDIGDGDSGVGQTERRTEIEKNMTKEIAQYVEKLGVELTEDQVKRLAKTVEDITNAGSFSKFLVLELAEKVGIKDLASKAMPVIGWINFGAQIIAKAKNAAPTIRRLGYAISSAAAVATFVTWASANDEAKKGNTAAELFGGLNGALGDTAGDADHQNQPAESSPLYQEIMGTGSQQRVGLLDIFSPQIALAADGANGSSGKSQYTCDDKSPVPAGKLVCPEEQMIPEVPVLDQVNTMFSTPPLNVLGGAADFWNSTAGSLINKVSSFAGDAIVTSLTFSINLYVNKIPGISDLQEKFGEWAGQLMQALAKEIFPTAVSTSMSGARVFNVMAGGADVIGNDSMHYNLGGKQLTDAQVAELDTDAENISRTQFAQKSLYDRMFDTDSSYSLVSKVAISMPSSSLSLSQNSVANLLTNPFSRLGSALTSVFAKNKVFAATAQKDPFGVVQFGYPANDPALNMDPELLTPEYCKEFTKKWAESATQDSNGIETHNTVNPCLLDQAVSQAGGAMFTDEVNSAEAPTSTPGQSDAGEVNSGSLADVVSNITTGIKVSGNTYDGNACQAGQDVSPPGGADGYRDGKLYKIRICKVQGIVINSQLSGNVDKLINAARSQGLNLSGGGFRTMTDQINTRRNNHCPDIMNSSSSSCSPPTARPGYSNHQMGFAIDFRNCGTRSTACYQWLNQNARSFGLINFPKEPWHWSIDGK